MKPTLKNQYALQRLKQTSRKSLELTTTGKVHDGFGILAAFTNRPSALEALAMCGFTHDPTHRTHYPIFTRP